jgi:D-amino peptidase
MKLDKFAVLAAIILSAVPWGSTQEHPKLKLYISVDMEGVVGVVSPEQLSPSGFEYAAFREIMTREVTAAVSAARDSGATEIVISDSHGNGQNLILDELPRNITLVRSFPRPLGMLQGLDNTFDAVIFLGYHAGASSPEGILAHTISSSTFADVRLNSKSVSEAVFNAAIAGDLGVPVIMFSGDDVAAKEASAALGNIETAVVKWAYGARSGRTMMPADAYDLISQTVKRAITRRREFRPFHLKEPIDLQVQFKNYRPAEVLSFLPIFRRVDSHTIQFTAIDMAQTSRVVEFIVNYDPAMQP